MDDYPSFPEPDDSSLDLTGAPLPQFDRAPSTALGPSPLRRPGSVRRTMTLDAVWPQGREGDTEMFGHARDVVTSDPASAPEILAEDELRIQSRDRTILALDASRPDTDLAALIGVRAGSHLRGALDASLHAERTAGLPLYLLLDDFAGASLVAGWAWTRWPGALPRRSPAERAAQQAKMAGVCMGFRPGASALAPSLGPGEGNATFVPPLPHPDDPAGWHPLIDRGGVNFRRARRIDLWRDGDRVDIDSSFQDSASTPEQGQRAAIHEYRLRAAMDAATGVLLSIEATPGTLPFAECPAAPVNITALLGLPLQDMRERVPAILRKTAGCTHLNDALRALAEVPALTRFLP